MKKMLLPIIFIVAVAALVLAGCVQFSTNLPFENETSESASESEALQYYVPVTDTAGVPVTDFSGNSIFVPAGANGSESQLYIRDAEGNYIPANSFIPPVTEAPFESTEITPPASTEAPPVSQAPVSEPSQAPVSEAPSTTLPVQNPNQIQNEYDIFRSGNFVLTGSMLDSMGASPMEMAFTPNSVYMKMSMGEADVAVLIADGDTYLMYPDKRAYMELTKAVMNTIGLNPEDMISSEDLGLSKLKPLSEAQKSYKSTVNGAPCTAYEMQKDDGLVSRVCMNGTKLLGIETVDENGKVISATYVDSISSVVPADRRSTAGYTKKTMLGFFTLLADLI